MVIHSTSGDMNVIFMDLVIETIEKDSAVPGVFVKACKPLIFAEKNLDDFDLYSIIRLRRCKKVNELHIIIFKAKSMVRQFLSRILPTGLKTIIKDLVYNK